MKESAKSSTRRLPKTLGTTLSALTVSIALAISSGSAAANDWVNYGSDLSSSKYAPYEQINAANAADVTLAWTWDSPDNATVAANHAAENFRATPGAFKVTPIAVDGILYLSTSFGRVAAVDGFSGKELWVYDTRSWEAGRPANLGYNHRGVAYWTDGEKQRILMPSNDAWLYSIDAETGLLDPDFGDAGRLDLTQGLGRDIDRASYTMISAPLVIGDIIVLGSSIHDGPSNKEAPPGHVRGFDAKTGEQVWRFNTIPQAGDFGNDTWEGDSWQYTGGTNVWTVMSADTELGIVYLPVGTPTNDWYGGHRLGDNLFAESLVAVDAKTGERIWHFQMVHHGMWDYDLPAAPNLVDIVVDGKPIKAVAQISKQGFVYVFDRVTGEPVWPIEERPVPQSNVPGERVSPTQPFPTKPAPFEPQGISDATLIDFTPELRAEALRGIERFDYGPIFTPPSLRGTINLPGWAGGGGWQGAAVDPETGMIYIPSGTGPIVVQLVEPEAGSSNFNYMRGGATSAAGPQGLPLTKPPYGRITAINLNTGEHEWMVPHGEGPRQRLIDAGVIDPGPVGTSDRTGPVLTKSLLFVAQTDNGRPVLRAYDKTNGTMIQEYSLPSQPGGTPMTYMANGKQFIAITVGGGQDAKLVTLALP